MREKSKGRRGAVLIITYAIMAIIATILLVGYFVLVRKKRAVVAPFVYLRYHRKRGIFSSFHIKDSRICHFRKWHRILGKRIPFHVYASDHHQALRFWNQEKAYHTVKPNYHKMSVWCSWTFPSPIRRTAKTVFLSNAPGVHPAFWNRSSFRRFSWPRDQTCIPYVSWTGSQVT